MAEKGKKRKTWSQIGVEHGGMRDTMRALEFAMNWGMVTALLEREPESIEEFAEEAGVSRATAFRDQQAFRNAFPMLEGPGELNRRARMDEAYQEVITLARDPVKWRPFVFVRLFTLGAAKANIDA